MTVSSEPILLIPVARRPPDLSFSSLAVVKRLATTEPQQARRQSQTDSVAFVRRLAALASSPVQGNAGDLLASRSPESGAGRRTPDRGFRRKAPARIPGLGSPSSGSPGSASRQRAGSQPLALAASRSVDTLAESKSTVSASSSEARVSSAVQRVTWSEPRHARTFKSLKKVDRESGISLVLHDADENDPHGEAAQLFAQDWLDRYVSEEPLFSSRLVFCELKAQELFKFTANLPRPNPFRTWIAADLLSKLITTLPDPRGQRALQRMFDVMLAGVYTDEATDRGLLLTHAVKGIIASCCCILLVHCSLSRCAARKLERELGLTAIKVCEVHGWSVTCTELASLSFSALAEQEPHG